MALSKCSQPPLSMLAAVGLRWVGGFYEAVSHVLGLFLSPMKCAQHSAKRHIRYRRLHSPANTTAHSTHKRAEPGTPAGHCLASQQ